MISVIIPIYNTARYIERCLSSLLDQSSSNWEAILVDDGSTDGCDMICKRYAKADTRFRYLWQENRGVSAARNTGIRNAKGEWILFVDSDDWVPKNAIQLFETESKSGNYDIIIGGYEVFDHNMCKTYWVDERIKEVLDRDSSIAMMYRPKYYRYLGFVSGKLYRSDTLRNNNICFNPNIYFNEDRLFCTTYLCYATKILYITDPVYSYFEHADSAMGSLTQRYNKRFETDLDAMILMKDLISEKSPINLALATEGVISSYSRIRWMMKQFHSYSIRILKLHFKVFLSLHPRKYFSWIVSSMQKKMSRILHYEKV